MIPWGAALAWGKSVVGWFRANPAALFVIIGFIVLAADFQAGRIYERRKHELAAVRAAQKATETARAADAKAVDRRAAGAAIIQQDRKEVNDAVGKVPDQQPSARQRARACVELRRQGVASPAC